jgi:hypothetical protein
MPLLFLLFLRGKDELLKKISMNMLELDLFVSEKDYGKISK